MFQMRQEKRSCHSKVLQTQAAGLLGSWLYRPQITLPGAHNALPVSTVVSTPTMCCLRVNPHSISCLIAQFSIHFLMVPLLPVYHVFFLHFASLLELVEQTTIHNSATFSHQKHQVWSSVIYKNLNCLQIFLLKIGRNTLTDFSARSKKLKISANNIPVIICYSFEIFHCVYSMRVHTRTKNFRAKCTNANIAI